MSFIDCEFRLKECAAWNFSPRGVLNYHGHEDNSLNFLDLPEGSDADRPTLLCLIFHFYTSHNLRRYFNLVRALLVSPDSIDFALKLLPLLSKRGAARLAAWLLFRAIRPLNFREAAKYKVLVIEKAVFNEDIRVALHHVDDIQLFGVGRAVIKAMALGVLPRNVCADDTYISDDAAARRAKQKYREFLSNVWRHLQRHVAFDAVLTGNWAYWAERELGAVLECEGTPFIVLHKEGIKPPARSELLQRLFRVTRGQFMGRRMLVYQEAERQHQIDGDISKPEQIVVVGMPRMDQLHNWRRQAAKGLVRSRAEKPLVLFLAFLPNNFLPSYSGLECDLAWNELCRGSLRAMVQVARQNPDAQVLIRPRGQEIDETWGILLEIIGHKDTLPSNLTVSTDGDAIQLVQAAWLIVGHNTTVLLEGLAAGKPVIVPDFAEALDPLYHGYIVDVGAGAHYPHSEVDLVRTVSIHCQGSLTIPAELSQANVDALIHWTGNADGQSAARVQAAVMHEIELSISGKGTDLP